MLKLHRWFVGLRGLTTALPGVGALELVAGSFWVSCYDKCFTMKLGSEHQGDARVALVAQRKFECMTINEVPNDDVRV